MFENSIIEAQKASWKQIVISSVVHGVMVIVLILIPLIYTDALPKQQLLTFLVAPPPPPPPPPPPEMVAQPVVVTQVQVDPGAMVAPTVIPRTIARFDDAPVASLGVSGGSGSALSGVLGGVLRAQDEAAPPPPPPPPPAPTAQRVRVGGNVQQANLLQQVKPVYPPLARQARIQGVVVLEAVISREGTIDNLKVITGHPLLIQAAIDAVSKWRYKPTMLNGEPVEVVTTITVNFAFSQ